MKILKVEQTEFIKNKVLELGSIQAVKRLYNKDCLVDKVANAFAHKVLPKEGESK